MLTTRVMPCLLLEDGGLVKTVKFSKPTYIGDPVNSVRIYNELEVDELIFLDIRASKRGDEPPFKTTAEIASECFMPFTYGGGIQTLDQAKRLFDCGVEKLALNTAAFENPKLIEDIVNIYGGQAVVIAMDVKKTLLSGHKVYICDGSKKTKKDPVSYAKEIEQFGVGEVLLNAIDRDGMMQGFDLDLIRDVSSVLSVPLIALGGAGRLADIAAAKDAGASAVALGSMAVYQNENKGILINFPSQDTLRNILKEGKAKHA